MHVIIAFSIERTPTEMASYFSRSYELILSLYAQSYDLFLYRNWNKYEQFISSRELAISTRELAISMHKLPDKLAQATRQARTSLR